MQPDESRIDALLTAIADESEVDWDAELRSATGADEREIISAMSSLASIQALARDALEPAPPPTRWGDLEILDRIGAGAFGTVYRARDPALDLEVALKVLDPRQGAPNRRILDEGRRLARLRHPNIVRVYGVDRRNDAIALRMELVRGRTLHEIVTEDGPRHPDEAMRTGIEICRALVAVHAAGLVHRDVKAQNVMRDEDGRIVLMDLGAGAKITPDGTGAGAAGTPLYLAPEALTGRGATARSDLFSLGVLLFFLVTGEYPVPAGDLEALRRAHAAGTLRALRDVRPSMTFEFTALVDQLLSVDPMRRPASADETARALSATMAASSMRPIAGDTPANRATVPAPITRFVGRRAMIRDAIGLVREQRLVTLVGPGGAGKTRLAIELCASYPDDVWFVELAPISVGDQVPDAIARAVGVTEVRGESGRDALIRGLGDARCLLVLDNCEHVLEGCAAMVAALLERAPGVRILATSREPLAVGGECSLEVGPMETPAENQDLALDDLARVESVRLFLENARAARHGFELTAETAPSVVEICRRLDGLPLALELAGARVRTLPVNEIAERLDDRFRLLTSHRRASLPRHRTLEACIQWSYDHLSPEEQRAILCLSVFAGGWTLAAAEGVLPEGAGIPETGVVDVLFGLVTKSLVHLTTDVTTGDARYRMLETILAFVRARRAEGEDDRDPAAAHRAYFATLAAEAGADFRTPRQETTVRRLEADRENLQAAIASALENDDVSTASSAANALGRFWLARGYWRLGRDTCLGILARDRARDDLTLWAGLSSWAGIFCEKLGDPPTAHIQMERALEAHRELDDRRGVALDLNSLGVASFHAGDLLRARRYYEESLALRRELDERNGIAQALNNLAIVLAQQGDREGARRTYTEALAIHRELGHHSGEATVLGNLGVLSAEAKDYDRARADLERALEIHRAGGDRWNIAGKAANLGWIAIWQDRPMDAERYFRESFAIVRAIEDRHQTLVSVLAGFVAHRLALDRPVEAARILGTIDALRDELGTRFPTKGLEELTEVEETVTSRLAADDLARERAVGRHQDLTYLLDDQDAGTDSG